MEKPNRTTGEKIAGLAVIAGIITIIFLFTRIYGIGFPISESVGDNVYLLDKQELRYSKGKLVAFYYRGEAFREYKSGDKFLKFAGCVSGDILTVQGQSYFCNGELIGKASLFDSTGKPMNQFIFNGEIPEGYFFALGTHPKSYDSRYWGLASDKDVYATAKAIF